MTISYTDTHTSNMNKV